MWKTPERATIDSIILDEINVSRLALPDERWNQFEMKRWRQFYFCEHLMTLLMTSLPRFTLWEADSSVTAIKTGRCVVL